MENKKWGSFWKCTSFLLLGVILGFILAPIKEGIYCGNNNGNHYCGDCCDDENFDEGIKF